MASEFFGRQRERRFYTAGCGNKMVVSVTGPRAANELGGPVIPGNHCDYQACLSEYGTYSHILWHCSVFKYGIALFTEVLRKKCPDESESTNRARSTCSSDVLTLFKAVHWLRRLAQGAPPLLSRIPRPLPASSDSNQPKFHC